MEKTIQEMLGRVNMEADTDADVVFCIDATDSMTPLIDKVKKMTLSFPEELNSRLEASGRKVRRLRVKVIAFRDFYVDGPDAMMQSEFFELPEENERFNSFVFAINAEGGGDYPESSLEALAEAMKSDFLTGPGRKRHIILLFTDAPAHKIEKHWEGVDEYYPNSMFSDTNELFEAWNGKVQDALGGHAVPITKMQKKAKRLGIFAPEVWPWNDVERDLEYAIRKDLEADRGGTDLDMEDVYSFLVKSME